MLDPDGLFHLVAEPADDLDRPALVHVLTGFVDAGSAGQLLRQQLLATLDHRTLAEFDVDQLLDYRSRRPPMVFAEDHWESYEEPSLRLLEVRDDAGTGFLLLDGAEPDVQWERFMLAVRSLVERFDVRLTVGVHGIPMGVPHTRATGVTAHATRRELVAGREPWVGTVQVPGSVGNLLEYRLGQAGHDALGFAAHVPHYLAQADYPDAAVALGESVAAATGLVLPVDELRTAADLTRTQVDEQVRESDDVAAVVRALEQQYDAYLGSRDRENLLAGRGGFPTADELGAELERFLADRTEGRDRDDPDGPTP